MKTRKTTFQNILTLKVPEHFQGVFLLNIDFSAQLFCRKFKAVTGKLQKKSV